MRALAAVAVVISGLAAGCEERKAAPAAPPAPAAPAPGAPAGDGSAPVGSGQQGAAARGVVSVAGVTMPIPEGWREVEPSNSMRLAELHIPGEPEPAVVAFSLAGGDVRANMQRWAGQFTGGGEPKYDQRQIAGMTVHTAEMDGSFSNMGAPAQSNYALRGAVVPIPGGQSLFIKLTGPRAVVEQGSDAFYRMLDGMQVADGPLPGGLQVPGR